MRNPIIFEKCSYILWDPPTRFFADIFRRGANSFFADMSENFFLRFPKGIQNLVDKFEKFENMKLLIFADNRIIDPQLNT